MTSAAPEPTDEQMRAAMDALGWDKTWDVFDLSCTQRAEAARVARALAAAVAAEREKYLRVAEELATLAEQATRLSGDFPFETGVRITAEDAARRIREVSR